MAKLHEVDFDRMHDLRTRMERKRHQTDVILSGDEVHIICELFNAAEGEIFPTRAELEQQQADVEALNRIDYKTDRERWDRLVARTNAFEAKYC